MQGGHPRVGLGRRHFAPAPDSPPPLWTSPHFLLRLGRRRPARSTRLPVAVADVAVIRRMLNCTVKVGY